MKQGRREKKCTHQDVLLSYKYKHVYEYSYIYIRIAFRIYFHIYELMRVSEGIYEYHVWSVVDWPVLVVGVCDR